MTWREGRLSSAQGRDHGRSVSARPDRTRSDLLAIIFDFDGLMIDTERVEADCIIGVLAGWGVEVCYRDFGHLFGSVDAAAEWEALLGGWCGRSVAELDAEIGKITTAMKDALPLLPGVRELLDVADGQGLKIGLGTGNSIETVRRRLGRLGVLDRFDAVVTRAEVAAGKPAPDIFLEVARRLAVPAERASTRTGSRSSGRFSTSRCDLRAGWVQRRVHLSSADLREPSPRTVDVAARDGVPTRRYVAGPLLPAAPFDGLRILQQANQRARVKRSSTRPASGMCGECQT
jgi:beta-phosphoglucomutase-like phosphatase (HAD superfamily)